MLRIFFMLLCAFMLNIAQAKTDIVLWHSLAGNLNTALQAMTKGFNQSQTAYEIRPVYKGDYIESLTSFAAAFRAHQPPALIQVFEVGTAAMLAPKGIIKPLDVLMKEEGLSLPKSSFFPAVRAAYSEQGQLMAMPFNTSVPALFYNADVLAKVGYSQKTFPRTWDELELLAVKLKKAGFSCVYTSAYPAWILIESYAALHGLPLMDTTTQKASFNHKKIVNHLERLLRWQRLHYFEYGGRTDDATVLFTSGRCPLLSQSSGAYNSLSKLVPFHVGLAPLPIDSKTDKRSSNVAGGAALWVVAGQTPEVYQGIARFFVYLATPAVQQHWHEATGYLPLGTTGIYQSLAHKNHHPALQLAEQELAEHDGSNALTRLGPLNQIRAINDGALELIFAGIKPPQEAMDDAVRQANHVLIRFLQNTAQ